MTAIELDPSELPIWMRRAQRRTDWGIVIVLAFALLTAWPLIFAPTLSTANDMENYMFRVSDYAATISEGRLYPRWSPNALDGYGAPIPNFYEPGAVYAAAVVNVLVTPDPLRAIRAVIIGALLLGTGTTYALVTRRSGAAAGIVAAALYGLSPYVSLTAPHLLGDFPGTVALGFIAMLMWATDRLMTDNRPQDFLLVCTASFVLLITDVPMAFAATLMALVFAAWHLLEGAPPRHLPQLILAMGVGALMGAFYWLPASLEQNSIAWLAERGQLVTPTVTLSTLLAPTRQVDPAALLPPPQLTLGWVRIAFAGASTMAVVAVQRRISFEALMLVVGVGIGAIMLVGFGEQTWLLGILTWCVACTVGALVPLRNRLSPAWQRFVLVAAIMTVISGSLPTFLLSNATTPLPTATGPSAQIRYEQRGFGVALLTPIDPIPTTMTATALPNRNLLESYETDNIERLNPNQLSSEVQVSTLDATGHQQRYQLFVASNRQLTFQQAYFPGWRATLNGEPLPVSAEPATGLLQVQFTRSTLGEVRVWLGTTPIRQASWVVSGCSALLALLITRVRYRRSVDAYRSIDLLTIAETRLLIVVLLLTGGLLAVVLQAPTALRAPRGSALQDTIATETRSDVGVGLLAYALDKPRYQPGDTLSLDLHWYTVRQTQQNYIAHVYLVSNIDDFRRVTSPPRNPGGYPTTRWTPNLYVTDTHRLALPATLGPGRYRIEVEMRPCSQPNCPADNRITFFGPNARVIGRTHVLPTTVIIEAAPE